MNKTAAQPNADENTVHIWVFSLDPTKKTKALKNKASRDCLHHALQAYNSKLRDDDLNTLKNPNGRPYLANRNIPIDFNLSHSQACCMVAITQAPFMVGIDLEYMRPLKQPDKLAKRIFSAQDLALWHALDTEKQTMALMQGWTRKEALTKALGLPAPSHFARWDTAFPPHAPTDLTLTPEPPFNSPAHSWAILDFIEKNLVGAIATNQPNPKIIWHKTA
jgi:hypothetical protein